MGQNDDMTVRAPDPGDSDRFKNVPSQEPESSGFQDAPKFETPPVYSEPPRPTETPSYGQVVEPPKKKNNKTLWIILIVVVLIICCCCIVAIVGGNNLMQEFNIEDFDDLLNEFSQLLRITPAFV